MFVHNIFIINRITAELCHMFYTVLGLVIWGDGYILGNCDVLESETTLADGVERDRR